MADVDKLHSNAGAGPGDMSQVSNMLHTARVRAGIELSDVAERLRIRLAYLEAIEEARFGDLPGPTYALGFVRAYADFLELDGREIVRQFKGEGQGLSRRQELVFPEPIQEGRFPGAQILVTALVLAGLVYGGWYYWQHRRAHPFAEVSPVPSNLATLIKPKPAEQATPAPASSAPASEPTSATAPKASDPATSSEPSAPQTETAPSTAASNPPAETQDTAPPAPTPLSSSQVSSTNSGQGTPAATESKPAASESSSASDTSPSAPAAETPKPSATKPAPAKTETAKTETAKTETAKPTPAQTASAKPAPAKPEAPKTATRTTPSDQQLASKPNETHVFGETEGVSHVTLIARQDSWLQVRDKSGQVLMTRILRAGDSYKVPNDPGLTLATGNAGALEVTVDGKEVPALGSVGAVRRNISLDPSKLAAGTTAGQ